MSRNIERNFCVNRIHLTPINIPGSKQRALLHSPIPSMMAFGPKNDGRGPSCYLYYIFFFRPGIINYPLLKWAGIKDEIFWGMPCTFDELMIKTWCILIKFVCNVFIYYSTDIFFVWTYNIMLKHLKLTQRIHRNKVTSEN